LLAGQIKSTVVPVQFSEPDLLVRQILVDSNGSIICLTESTQTQFIDTIEQQHEHKLSMHELNLVLSSRIEEPEQNHTSFTQRIDNFERVASTA
jgi:hypothetical protein